MSIHTTHFKMRSKPTNFAVDDFVGDDIAMMIVVIVVNVVVVCRVDAQFINVDHVRGLHVHHQIPRTHEIVFTECAQQFGR